MIIKGQKYYTTRYQADIEVLRVAKNQAWADILVKPISGAASWRKRQQLVNGAFTFPVVRVGAK